MKDRIKNLLAQGVKAVDIATIVGCSPSYVSQLLNDASFKEEVQNIAIANAAEKSEDEHLDTRYQNLEHKLISNIETEMGNAEFPQLVRALEVIGKRNGEKARAKLPAPANNGTGVNIHITQIALPAHALQLPAPVIQLNEKNEIIAIDAKPLAPMSSDGVKNIFAQIKERKEQQLAAITAQNKAVVEI